MFKLLKSNLREIILLSILLPLMLTGLSLLGNQSVAQNGHLSELISLAVSLLGGVLRFGMVLLLAWIGLAITFPEAGKTMFGNSFDIFWAHTPLREKSLIALAFTAILIIAAALCMAA